MAAKTRKDYEEEAILRNWATAQPGTTYSTGSGMQQYTGWNGGSVTGADVMAGTSDSIRYGYDVALDPRASRNVRDAIGNLLLDVDAKANADAVAGIGDYDTNRQNYLDKVGWTDYQNVFKNLQETGTLGLTNLEGQDLTELALQQRDRSLPGTPYEWAPGELEALQQATAAQREQQAYLDAHLSPLMRGNGGENGGAWGYDQNTDPVWNAILSQHTRAGEKAMNDALAQLSARTGGMASSYAGQVAQQTMNDYLQGATDYIPELYEAAYGRYMDEQNMRIAEDERAYQRQQDALDRQLAADQTAWERQMYQNELEADERNQGMDLLLSMMGIGYQPTSEELSRYGLNQGMADAIYGDYLRGITPKASGGGSGGSQMTYSQAYSLLKDGVDSPIARQIYESYTGIPWDPSLVEADDVSKPNLSYDNIVELLDSGTVNDQLLSGYKYYTGQDHPLASLSDPSVASISDYEGAISKLKEIGASKKDQMALATENEWRRKRESGSNSPEAAYDSYEEYLWAYIEFILNG